MLVTEDFVMLNFPKTGSSYAREVIKRVYDTPDTGSFGVLEKLGLNRPSVRELMMPKIHEAMYKGVKDQHGVWQQIPGKYKSRQVLSIKRNPFSRYLSAFHYGWWKTHPPATLIELKQHFPGFPQLSFSEYYEMTNIFSCRDRLSGILPKIDIGLHSLQFIQFYFKDPESVIRKIDAEYIESGAFKADMADVYFLEQEKLSADLKGFLIKLGAEPEMLNFLDEAKRVNVTPHQPGEYTISDLLLDYSVRNSILERDRLIFEIFPEYLCSMEGISNIDNPSGTAGASATPHD